MISVKGVSDVVGVEGVVVVESRREKGVNLWQRGEEAVTHTWLLESTMSCLYMYIHIHIHMYTYTYVVVT